MTNQIRNAKKIHSKAKTHQVAPTGLTGVYEVVSGHSGNRYMVVQQHDGDLVCNCDWGTCGGEGAKSQSACSHVQAVVRYQENAKARSTSAWSSMRDAFRQHRPVIDIGDGVVITSRRKARKSGIEILIERTKP